jgi:hypothetical protein
MGEHHSRYLFFSGDFQYSRYDEYVDLMFVHCFAFDSFPFFLLPFRLWRLLCRGVARSSGCAVAAGSIRAAACARLREGSGYHREPEGGGGCRSRSAEGKKSACTVK